MSTATILNQSSRGGQRVGNPLDGLGRFPFPPSRRRLRGRRGRVQHAGAALLAQPAGSSDGWQRADATTGNRHLGQATARDVRAGSRESAAPPRAQQARRGRAWGSLVLMGDPSCPDMPGRTEPQPKLRNALDANSRCRPMRRLRRVVSNVGREPGFGATLVRRLRLSRTAGEMSPAPSPRATRHGWAGLILPGISRVPRRSPKRARRAAAWPFSWIEPPSDRCGPSCLAGRLPGHRHYSDAALLRLSATTSASADNAALAASGCGDNSTLSRRPHEESS